MYKVTLKQGYQNTELEYATAEGVKDLLFSLYKGTPEAKENDLEILVTILREEGEF